LTAIAVRPCDASDHRHLFPVHATGSGDSRPPTGSREFPA
jgi:hypothetical protein